GPLNIDPESVTASGISAGAAMATQLHVALSATVQGAALFAGVPFHCAQGLLAEALTCMSAPGLVPLATLISETNSMEARGSIDATVNLADDRAYIFAGSLDTVVNPAAGEKAQDFYEHYGTTVVSEYTVAAEHCQPTDNYGPECSYLGDEYINNCDYNGAYQAFSALYGDITKPDGTEELPGTFDEFDQSVFISGTPSSISMDDVGFVYIPSACADGSTICKLHIALHGCLQGRELIGDAYASNGEYLRVAELNNIVVVFPQAVKTVLSNPNGCWDWWGYTGIGYSGRNAPQIVAIKAMIDVLIG
ncbi:Alpha/Beta hydrolase fold, partial [Trinorchestia longiramus]